MTTTAQTMKELWWSDDEYTDPHLCEYSKTNRRGGNLFVGNKIDTRKLVFGSAEEFPDDKCDDIYHFRMTPGELASNDLAAPRWVQLGDLADVLSNASA
jgi:hypothetical protein